VRIVLGSFLLVFSVFYPYVAFAQGDAQAGKARWENLDDTRCGHCHGMKGEGAYGPDLAGRQLSFEQFKQAVRKPWGVMPAYPENQISDQVLQNFHAYMTSLPRVTSPGPWRTPMPANAPYGQRLIVETVGCGQCHGDTMLVPRQDAGGVNGDFEWFKKLVYDHTNALPEHRKMLGVPVGTLRMGNYSRARLPEPVLEEIWKYMRDDLKFRVPVTASLKPGSGGTYDLEVGNEGLAGKGFSAEDVTITLTLKPGTKVKGTTGEGYKGVKTDAKGDMAVWQVAKVAPKADQKFTITLESGGIAGGTVNWMKPALGNGKPDQVAVTMPRPSGQ
jgi:mono/diheme cytochrome c family protein